MDSEAKQELLIAVIKYATLFQNNRRRSRMSCSDIHEAIHALGFRPLFSTLSVTGDETVSTTDVVSDHISSACGTSAKLHVIVPIEAAWSEPKETFRKRRWESKTAADFKTLNLSPKSEHYIQTIVNSVASGHLTSIHPPCDSDILFASWFLGLYFSETIEKSLAGSLHWNFVRSAVWYLHMAIETHQKISCNTSRSPFPVANQRFPESLSAPWLDGLRLVASGKVGLQTVSPTQTDLIKSVCSRLYSQLALSS